MASVIPQTIEWITVAPIVVRATAESAATPDAVFAVLADHERFPEWFPAVRRVTVLGPAAGVGARRRVCVPGLTVDEEFVAWEPGRRFAFTAFAIKPRIFRSLLEDCVLRPTSAGGTSITYTMYLDPPGPLRWLLRLASGSMRINNARAMRSLARRAETASGDVRK
jgi:uncharacterized protein YndB with AHSA1/START domain